VSRSSKGRPGDQRDPLPDRDPAWEVEAASIAERVDWGAALPPNAGTWWWMLRQGFKRALDTVLAAAGLILLSPLFLVVGILVASDGGPVFYRWRVIGYRGGPFTGFKFRTMVPNADALKDRLRHLNQMSGPVFKIREDPRVTPLGRFLRRHSVDELPQLWSVLVGDMSLVGPRPPSAREFVQFKPGQHAKLAVRPGLTCLWQVSGRSEITNFDDWIALDLRYIREWTLWQDAAILLRTVWVVLRGSGGY
jgi:lipopolysaccharide/colanic/teichoic acid biosynthesis glycosyltransferase